MIQIVPNTGGVYVTRKGNELRGRSGELVAMLAPATWTADRIQEGIEILLSYRPVESEDHLREELERVNKRLAHLESERGNLLDRISRARTEKP